MVQKARQFPVHIVYCSGVGKGGGGGGASVLHKKVKKKKKKKKLSKHRKGDGEIKCKFSGDPRISRMGVLR